MFDTSIEVDHCGAMDHSRFGQVGEVQYGGKITDDLDRRLFKAYTETWMTSAALSPSFCFIPWTPMQDMNRFDYVIPNSQEVGRPREWPAAYYVRSEIRREVIDSSDLRHHLNAI